MLQNAAKRILPYVIMGILLNKDCTGKQIMDEFRFDIGEFWQSSHSQVYPELKRMEQDRWIESYSKEDNDKEIHYHLTAYGHEIINDWLMEPVDKLPVSKDLFSLKTFSLMIVMIQDWKNCLGTKSNWLATALIICASVDKHYSAVKNRLINNMVII